MKYSEAQYLNAEYWEPDEETSHNKMQIVKTRKEHTCVGLAGEDHDIPKGTKAILETAIHCDDGRVSCYLCLECADTWLDELASHGAI